MIPLCDSARILLSTAVAALLAAAWPFVNTMNGQSAAVEASSKVSVRVAPSRNAGLNARIVQMFEQYFEPTVRTVETAIRASDLSATHCGHRDEAWLKSFREKNGRTLEDPPIPSGTSVVLPPCPFWTLNGEVIISPGDTVSSVIARELGQAGPEMLSRVAALNKRSPQSIHAVEAGDSLQVPFKVGRVVQTVKPEFRTRVGTVVDAINSVNVPEAVKARVESVVSLVAEAEARCDIDGANQEPFDAERVADILDHNEKIRRIARKAVVAVLDTGIDPDEQRLFLARDPDGNVGFNVDRRQSGFPTTSRTYPFHAHGTHVAGLILGGLGSSRLTAAVQKRIELRIGNIVTTEVTPNTAGGPPIETFSIPLANVQEAILQARRDPPAPIINLSVETPTLLDGLVDLLRPGDYVIVVAAGNGQDDIDITPVYPAHFRNDLPAKILSVAAHGPNGEWATFSNQGPGSVDLTAPGCNVRSTLPGGATGAMTGTSQAAPLVTFTAALLYSEGLTPRQIVNRIRATVQFEPSFRQRVSTAGRLDIDNALSVYDDLVYVRGASQPRKGQIVTACLPVAGHPCRPLETLARVVARFDDARKPSGMAWLYAADGQLISRPTEMPAGAFSFKPNGATQTEPIPWEDVTDVIFAARRVPR